MRDLRSTKPKTTLKLTAVGSATGAVLPAEMLARLNVALGDTRW